MSKKFIKTDPNGRVTLIHNMPFDSVNGFHKTEAELLAMGVLLEADQMPEPERRAGKIAAAFYTPEEGFHWVYEDAPEDGQATTGDIQALNAKLDYFMMMQEVI